MTPARPLVIPNYGIDDERDEAPAPRPMKFALGIHKLDPRGGLEDQCMRIAGELMRRGHSVTAFVAGPPIEAEFPVVPLTQRGTLTTNHGLASDFARAFMARVSEGIDRTISFQLVPGADFLFMADGLRDRAEIGTLRRFMPRFKVLASLEAGVFGEGSATEILCLSNTQKNEFVGRYPASADRIRVLPPSLSPDRCRPEMRTTQTREAMREKYGIPQGSRLWLWAALQPMIKGLDRVIEALSRRPDVHLMIGGPDADDTRVERLLSYAIGGAGLRRRVHRVGYLPGADMLSAMAGADLLVHPARVETTGAIILESVVNGLPVVATQLCGFAEHIEKSGCGIVIDGEFDQQRFEDALAAIERASADGMSSGGKAYGLTNTFTDGINAACDILESGRTS